MRTVGATGYASVPVSNNALAPPVAHVNAESGPLVLELNDGQSVLRV
jgi:hypothetical protein